jgi:hypothetical protein
MLDEDVPRLLGVSPPPPHFSTLSEVNDLTGLAADQLVVLPPEVQAAIDQVLPSSDPLDRPDLNVVDYINTLFPTEQSLAGLDETISDLNARVEEIEQETRNMVRSQVRGAQDDGLLSGQRRSGTLSTVR